MKKFIGKTILVTGATGLIGSNLIFELIKINNVKIIALSRNMVKLKRIFKHLAIKNNIKFIEHDISLPINNIRSNIDYIFHAASPQENIIIEKNPLSIIKPNTIGTLNCLNLLSKQKKMNKSKARLIFISSITIYGNKSNKDIRVLENETALTNNIDSLKSPYSESKRMGEVIIKSFIKENNVDAVICRPSTVYGNTAYKTKNAFNEFISKAIKKKNIIVKNNDNPRRDNIYITDTISGLLIAACKGKKGEAYNISSNGEKDNFASVDQIANKIVKLFNKKYNKNEKIKFIYKNKNLKKRKPGIILDNKKLRKLGWRLNISLDEGIDKTLQFSNVK